jgi:hypothetical protein
VREGRRFISQVTLYSKNAQVSPLDCLIQSISLPACLSYSLPFLRLTSTFSQLLILKDQLTKEPCGCLLIRGVYQGHQKLSLSFGETAMSPAKENNDNFIMLVSPFLSILYHHIFTVLVPSEHKYFIICRIFKYIFP